MTYFYIKDKVRTFDELLGVLNKNYTDDVVSISVKRIHESHEYTATPQGMKDTLFFNFKIIIKYMMKGEKQ